MYNHQPTVHQQAPIQHPIPPHHHTNAHNTHHQLPQQQQQQPQQLSRAAAAAAAIPKSPINVVGVPSVFIENNRLVVGSSQSSSTRSYTLIKVLGDGSFGTVWLCDWHGTLPPNTPLSPMQCGAGARPEWAGKRLVAVKKMKKKWEGGWDECQKLKEIESLRAIPFHPNIIPLYDFFLLPATKELYFVFESMEGNLYHLIKARKGRALAGGLVASIFHQMVSGLKHIHSYGYFHRDMKPENVLVTTTGLFDYTSLSPAALPNSPPEKDVVAIIKLADFGLARETNSAPPYTEYVSTRWYRAPEVLLLSRDYSNPVDMWAVGTIMAELVNLRPMFPGADQVDQMARICELLGDPSDEYGIGGGAWPKGINMARNVGFLFRKMIPKDIRGLFDRNVPLSLIECIRDLLYYDPERRLNSQQCLDHRYLRESLPVNNIPLPPALRVQTLPGTRRTAPSPTTRVPNPVDYPMTDVSPQTGSNDSMDIVPPEVPVNKPKKKVNKWNPFATDKSQLPPVQEIPPTSANLKRPQSSGSGPLRPTSSTVDMKKSNKKEAERLQREAEKQRRALAEKMNRDRARAVMQKRNQIISKTASNSELEWRGGTEQMLDFGRAPAAVKGKQAATGPIRQGISQSGINGSSSRTVHAASGRFASPEASTSRGGEWNLDDRATKKARTREHDDNYSLDSSSIQSSRMSTLSFATVDSDPGPSRIRNRPSIFGLNRMQSSSSLRTSFDDFSPRSSQSMSFEGQLAQDFRNQASMGSPLPGSVSPPPMHTLTISPSLSPSLSPSPTWMPIPHQHNHQDTQDSLPPYINMPHPQQKRGYSPFDFNGRGASAGSYGNPPSPYRPSASSAHSQKSDINPIFQVPTLPSHRHAPSSVTDEDDYDESISALSSPTSLPPFSELEAYADAGAYDYPPVSPMSLAAGQRHQ